MTIARYFIIAIFLFAPSAAARQGGAITGRVVADDGEGMANVTVFLYTVGPRSGVPRMTTTDENGKFRFSDLDQNEYTINVSDFGGYVRTPPSEAERQRPRYYRIGDDVLTARHSRQPGTPKNAQIFGKRRWR